MPGTILASDCQAPELRKALEQSFAELEQCEPPRAFSPRGRVARSLLSDLKRFVQRELAYLQTSGDLLPGDLEVDEVIDESLARAFENVTRLPRRLARLPWLYQIAITLSAEEVTRRQAEEGRGISLEGRLRFQLWETQEADDEILFEYWQPDEVLRLEDVM